MYTDSKAQSDFKVRAPHPGGDKPRPYKQTLTEHVRAGFIPALTKRTIAPTVLLESLNLGQNKEFTAEHAKNAEYNFFL
ncbi:MAG: hypothetical protein KJP23_18270 [Deltaproteobacteria bacterium]|nr:hypothetical protein [Deltaproteobacteria bacterium]